ncbi:MAG: HEAT repeat domain-containing protein, partial [Myxococcota bacterium]
VRSLATRALGGWLTVKGADAPRRMTRFARAGLSQALLDPEEIVRLEAARALGAVGRPDDARQLAPLLREDSEVLRVEAAAALLRLTDAP